eukprot:15466414-Alexandrium_andersonii.AAC.1
MFVLPAVKVMCATEHMMMQSCGHVRARAQACVRVNARESAQRCARLCQRALACVNATTRARVSNKVCGSTRLGVEAFARRCAEMSM